jgi:hypothetical protein
MNIALQKETELQEKGKSKQRSYFGKVERRASSLQADYQRPLSLKLAQGLLHDPENSVVPELLPFLPFPL